MMTIGCRLPHPSFCEGWDSTKSAVLGLTVHMENSSSTTTRRASASTVLCPKIPGVPCLRLRYLLRV